MALTSGTRQPPQVALHPIGAGESRRLPVGEIGGLNEVAWFPDGKHLLLIAGAAGPDLRDGHQWGQTPNRGPYRFCR